MGSTKRAAGEWLIKQLTKERLGERQGFTCSIRKAWAVAGLVLQTWEVTAKSPRPVLHVVSASLCEAGTK